VKRATDVLISLCALVLLSPVLLALAALISLIEGRPVLFRQDRAGRHGVPFTMYKFRTMNDPHDESGRPLLDRDRITPFGSWLRSTSLDELPQLVNVAWGQMSLVGPRPLPVAYLPRYTDTEARRHEVRPGLTGWAQIHGRNLVGWEDRLALDTWYVDHRSMLLDIKILFETVRLVLKPEGISAEGEATMSELRPERRPDGPSVP
jgi:sugar transferase EpsL